MSQGRSDDGQFGEKMRDQDHLKVFDYADDPMLTTQEVANGLIRTSESVSQLKLFGDDFGIRKRMISSRVVTGRNSGWDRTSYRNAARVDHGYDDAGSRYASSGPHSSHRRQNTHCECR